jgi:branched-chain amino acid transport system substrate-binding protein
MNRSIAKFFTSAMAMFAFTASALAQTPLKIGFVADTTGSQAALARDIQDGFMLVVNRNGGKLGGVPVQVIAEDMQLKPDVANQVVRRLVEKENVPIIAGFTASNTLLAVHKYITDREVFLISANAGPSQIAGAQCSPYQYITSWQGDQASEAMGLYANAKGYKKIMVLAPNYQAGKDVIAGFKRFYKGQIVNEVYTPLSQLDFAAELTDVSQTKPDAVFAFYPGALGQAFVKQYQQAGLLKTLPLLSSYILDAISLPGLQDAALGQVTSGFWGPDFDNEASKRFVSEFEKKYGRIPSNFAAQSYDAAQLLDSAIAKVGGKVADKKAFAAALKAADFRSVRGGFRFNTNHFPLHDMHVFEVVKDGGGRYTLKTIATPMKSQPDAYYQQCLMK